MQEDARRTLNNRIESPFRPRSVPPCQCARRLARPPSPLQVFRAPAANTGMGYESA